MRIAPLKAQSTVGRGHARVAVCDATAGLPDVIDDLDDGMEVGRIRVLLVINCATLVRVALPMSAEDEAAEAAATPLSIALHLALRLSSILASVGSNLVGTSPEAISGDGTAAVGGAMAGPVRPPPEPRLGCETLDDV